MFIYAFFFFVDYSVQNTLLSFTFVMTAYTRRNRNRSSLRSRRHNAGGKTKTWLSSLPKSVQQVFSGLSGENLSTVKNVYKAIQNLPKEELDELINHLQTEGHIPTPRTSSSKRRSSKKNTSFFTAQNGLIALTALLGAMNAAQYKLGNDEKEIMNRQDTIINEQGKKLEKSLNKEKRLKFIIKKKKKKKKSKTKC